MADDNRQVDNTPSDKDEALLQTIREDYAYCKSYWHENYSEAKKDMDAVACIPPEDFKNDRSGRPCIWPDEISQYVKQANNNLRQNKRSIKVSPISEEATDKDAEHRQAYIRGIEYASAAQSIYSTAFESCVECAFGFWRVGLKKTGPKGEQEPRLYRIPNWRTVLMDPDAQESDFSDSRIAFVTDTMRHSVFLKKYPNAKVRSFDGAQIERAPGWLNQGNITVAEYWTREEAKNEDGEARYTVTQYITNGLEILETHEWIGSWIPIVGVFGEELYIGEGNESKRMFLSLTRRARAPQQMLAYIASQEAEEFGMAPRAPYLLLKGTVIAEEWKLANRTPKAYLEYKIPIDWNTAWGPPPAPQRQPFIPNAQAYEVAFERWRRSLQASMGIAPLPTSAQRQNEKSGIALEKIQNQEAVGSFHFTDNFTRALANTGRQLNELITKLAELDSLPQHVLGRDQKDEDLRLPVAPRQPQEPEPGENQENADPFSEHLPQEEQFFAHRGQFAVTVSDGPNYASQREEGSEFVDTMLQALPQLGLPPALTQQVLAIAVKLKNIGTYGDEIADLLAPPDPNGLDPKAKAIIAQMQGQMQQSQAVAQQLMAEKQGKVVEMQGKMAIEQQRSASDSAEADKDRLLKLVIAEIETKAQDQQQRDETFMDMMKQLHQQTHELVQQRLDHIHEATLAQQQQQMAAQSQASDQAHQAGLAAQQQAAQAQQPQGE